MVSETRDQILEEANNVVHIRAHTQFGQWALQQDKKTTAKQP